MRVQLPHGRISWSDIEICRTKAYALLSPRQVSWVRQRDLHILTVGRFTYTNDQRFSALHVPGTLDWTLKILSPTQNDSGVYECHVSTNPKMSKQFHLDVTGQ